MANEPIPEDLKALYQAAQAWRHSFGSREFVGAGTVGVLIERIARLEAENGRLCAPVSDRELIAEAWDTDDEGLRQSINAIISARKEAK